MAQALTSRCELQAPSVVAHSPAVKWLRGGGQKANRETELLAHDPAKDVTSWLGNSPDVADKHYAMTMQASFDQAIVDGAKIFGVTTIVQSSVMSQEVGQIKDTGVVTEKTPQNPPQTLRDNGVLNDDTKKADAENPVNNWICLASAISVLPLSYPART